MPRLSYLAHFDAIHYFQKYRPIVADMSRNQLEMLILLILNGEEIDYAFDHAMSSKIT